MNDFVMFINALTFGYTIASWDDLPTSLRVVVVIWMGLTGIYLVYVGN